MTREIRRDLRRAKELYRQDKYVDAYEIYDRHYRKSPERFNHWDKVRYCWCMYYLFIRDGLDEGEMFEYAEAVTDIVRQDDLNESPVCVYTMAVFRVIMFLKSKNDWEYMLYWLDKLNPELLNSNEKDLKDSRFASKKEDYYRYLSTAYLKCGDYEDCIKASKEALEKVENFAYNGDVWHKWRIAKSLNRLGYAEDALPYLWDVIKVRHDWYIYKELSDCCHQIAEDGDAIKYAREAVLADGSADVKVNLYHLIYGMLKDTDPAMARKHAELVLALKLESGANVPEDIEDLNIDEADLDIGELEREIMDYWS